MKEVKEDKIQFVPVSSVITASFCPVKLSLDARSARGRDESPRYVICKQISSHLGGEMDPAEIWDEVLAISPETDVALYEFLKDCVERCERGGPFAPCSATEVHLRSDKYGLVGNLDKLHDGEPYISIVRTVAAPGIGVYSADRLRIFGYLLMLNEMTGRDLTSGAVEYIPSGISRICTPRPIDKRRFFKALNDAKAILSGEHLPRPTGLRCRTCESYGACSPFGRKLSDIL